MKQTPSQFLRVGEVNQHGIYDPLEDIKQSLKEPMYKRAINGIGYLAQEASVFRKLSVEDNIKAVLELGDLSEEEQTKYTSPTEWNNALTGPNFT